MNSLKILKIHWTVENQYSPLLAQVLPCLHFLEHLALITETDVPIPDESAWVELLSSLPSTLKTLHVDRQGKTGLMVLAGLISGNRLPALEHLILPNMVIDSLSEMEDLGQALRAPGAPKIKTLHVNIIEKRGEERDYKGWDLLIRILSMDVEDPENQILPCLTKLVIGNLNWHELGVFLVEGRFPKLEVIKPSPTLEEEVFEDSNSIYHRSDMRLYGSLADQWYRSSDGATDLWMDEVLPNRPLLRPFDDRRITFHDYATTPLGRAGMKGFLKGLPQAPLAGVVASCVEKVDIDIREQGTCIALVKVIESRCLASVKSLHLGFPIPAFSLEAFKALGGALHKGSLPSLTCLSLGVPVDHPVACSQALIDAIPPHGLSKVQRLLVGCNLRRASQAEAIFLALANSEMPVSPFDHVSVLEVTGPADQGEIAELTNAISCGVFPALEVVRFRGE